MILSAFLLLTSLATSDLYELAVHHSSTAKTVADTIQKPGIKNYAILPISQVRFLSRDFTGYSAGELNSADFIVIEAKLNEFAKQYNQEADKIRQGWIKQVPTLKRYKTSPSIKLTNYKRQYVCGINKEGDKIVWVNCFCSDSKEHLRYWKQQVVFVMDGGDCYFNLKINLSKKTKYDIMVNGIA
jgi:hypothetical protein